MTSDNILKAVSSIKMKNSEGDDRIPQRIIIDGISLLLRPLTVLFGKIYETKNLIKPDWLNLSLIAFKLKVKDLFLMNR